MATEGRVTIGQLGDDNYGGWSKRIKALLESKNLRGIIEDDEDDKDKSRQVKGLLTLYLDDYHLQMADEAVTAKGLWDKLKETFKASTNARRLLLRQQLNNLRKGHKETITQYVARAKGIASNLETIRPLTWVFRELFCNAVVTFPHISAGVKRYSTVTLPYHTVLMSAYSWVS